MKYFLFFIFALGFAQNAFAKGLEHRNIPDARLLYEDQSGQYYGALMSFGNDHPNQSPASDIVLKIYAERIPNPDGTFINVTPAKSRPYEGADLVDGSHLTEPEIARISNHVIPAIDRVFPEWRSHSNWEGYHSWVFLEIYIKDVTLEDEDGGMTPSYSAEDPVSTFTFKPLKTGAGWRPAYEINEGLLGHPVAPEFFTVASAIKRRGQITTEASDGRSEVLAAFARHGAYKAELESQRDAAYFKALNASRRLGIVYKTGSYWNRYKEFETPRNIIEGNFNFIKHPEDFAASYLTYMDQFYKVCEAYLPAQRTSYTAQWFETRYGVTLQTGSFYVEMDARYKGQYERMSDLRNLKAGSQIFTSIVNALGQKDGRSPFSFFGDIVQSTAQDIVSSQEMGRFLKNEGCNAGIVKQFADNLWRGAQGLPAVQSTTLGYPAALAETQSYVLSDALRHQEKSWDAMARNPYEGPNGYPYYDEEVVAYRTGMGMANDGRGQVPAMREVGLKLQEKGYPVLYCYYGPTGFLNDGNEYDTFNIAVWYENKPPELDSLIAAMTESTDLYRGMNYALSTCPENSKSARDIINGR